MKTTVHYCKECNTPLLKEDCDRCGNKGIEINGDLRPVFKEEVNLLEKIAGVKFNFKVQEPFLWANIRNVIVCGNIFFKVIGGGMNTPPRIEFVNKNFSTDVLDEKEAIKRLGEANKVQLSKISERSKNFVREVSEKYNDRTFLVSFSGGKDSTVVSDIVVKALGTKKIWHAFGDTTLEFPTTYEYVNKYRDINDIPFIPQILVKANGDFYNLCE
jgi:phosphoadenosine phosphosulfate reductase